MRFIITNLKKFYYFTPFVGTEKTKKKVIFIDKPLPLPHPSKADLSRICHKLLLRSNLCEFEAFKFPTPDSVIKQDDSTEVEENESITKEGKAKQPLFWCFNFYLPLLFVTMIIIIIKSTK